MQVSQTLSTQTSPGSDQGSDIRVTHVRKTYGSGRATVPALDDVSLQVDAGEFVSLLGPSGCGKSTLLMLMAGLLQPTTGEIEIARHRVTRPVRDVGIVFQTPTLLPWRTVIQNVLLQTQVRHWSTNSYRPVARSLLEGLGLSEFEDAYPSALSGGMQQRVSIARALIHDPSLLLMDEPFGALDALTRDQMNIDLQDRWLQSHQTVVFVTHDITEAVMLSDRVLVMSGRPATVDHDITIELPRPRRLAIRESQQFNEYTRRIRQIFLDAGVLRENL